MANFHQLAKQAAARRGQSGGHGFSYLVTCERSPQLHFMPVQPQVVWPSLSIVRISLMAMRSWWPPRQGALLQPIIL